MAISEPAKSVPAASARKRLTEEIAENSCFVISPIGDDGTETRKKADQVLRHIIKKALSEAYEVERADDISKPGLITLQIIERLMKAPMVVADLTDLNANVYYELAIRHFVKKPVVHLITEGQKPPFDVAQMRYIRYDLTDPDSVERAALELREHAAACEKGEVTFTPIQFVEMLDTARGEGEYQFADLALGIQSALSNLQSDVRQLGTQVSYLTAAATDELVPFSIPSGRVFSRLGSRAGIAGLSVRPSSGITADFSGQTPVTTLGGRKSLLSALRGTARSTSAAASQQDSALPIESKDEEAEPTAPTPDFTPKDQK